MADQKISQLASGAPAQGGDEYVVARSGDNFKLTLTNIAASMPPIGSATPNTGAFTTVTATTGNITAVNATTVDATNVEVTNLKAKDGTAAMVIADSTGVVTVDSSVLTTTDINGGTIDGAVIGGASAAAGTFTTVSATIGNITTVNATTVDATNVEATNVKALDGTAAITIANSTGAVTLSSTGTATKFVPTGNVTAGNGMYLPAANTVAFSTNGSERLRLDSAGNVGIGGTAAAASKLAIAGTLPTSSNLTVGLDVGGTIPSGTTSGFDGVLTRSVTAAASFTLTNLYNFRATQGTLGAGSAVTNQYGFAADSSLTGATNNYGFYSNIAASSNRWNFFANGTAANYFAGNVLVGRTTVASANSERLSVEATGNSPAVYAINAAGANDFTCVAWNKATTGNNKFAGFFTEAAPTERGSITYNRSGGLVAYNTTSDYRAKDVYEQLANSGEIIDALKVYRGRMKSASEDRPMLLAHEAQEIVSYAVTGNKDAVDQDGNPVYQQMDHQVLVPLLIAELQSLRKRVAELEAKGALV